MLQELVRKGIPHHFRGIAWQLLCNAHNSAAREAYAEYLKMQSPFEKVRVRVRVCTCVCVCGVCVCCGVCA